MTTVQEKNPNKIQTNTDKNELKGMKEMSNLYGKMLGVTPHVIERPKEYLDKLEYMNQTLKKLGEQITGIIETGRKYGIPDIEIGNDIRRMAKGHFDPKTIARYLPTTAKHQEKNRFAGKTPANIPKNRPVTKTEEVADWVKEARKTQAETETIEPIHQMPAEEYKTKHLLQYDKLYLIKIVEWYEKKKAYWEGRIRDIARENQRQKKEIEELQAQLNEYQKKEVLK